MVAAFWECFLVSLRLGLMSFGGPVAHLGFFQREYVERRGWVTATTFSELLALCQVLPGPASSQLGAAIGVERGGLAGGFGAWLGFTLPSALFLGVLGLGWTQLVGDWAVGAAMGLAAVTVVVVASATWQLGRKLCFDAVTVGLALAAAVVILLSPFPWVQPVVIILGGLVGTRTLGDCRVSVKEVGGGEVAVGRAVGCLAVFGGLLALSYLGAGWLGSGVGQVMAGIYGAGGLVFGGGHVVLPLLEQSVVGERISQEAFVAGYGAAQAVPGPLFTFAAFLGAVAGGPLGLVLGTILIFLPGMLLLAAALPQRAWLSRQGWAPGAVAGAGASVVGLLGAALIQLILAGAITEWWQATMCLVMGVTSTKKWIPVWALVLLAAGLGAALG